MSRVEMSDDRTAFVMSGAVPMLGMEVVTRDLLRALNGKVAVEVIVGGGETWPGEDFPQRSLGGQLSGWRRVMLVRRFLKWRRGAPRDVVVVVGVWAALPWLVLRSRTTCVIWEHSLSLEKVNTSRGLRTLSRVVPTLYRRAWRVVCVSETLASDVARLTGRDDIEVIPNVVEVANGASPRAANPEWPPRRLLCVGSLTSTKRQSVAIEALAGLDATVTLTIVGDGPMRSRLMELSMKLGVEDRVTFLGHVDRTRVLGLMQESDVLVHPAAGETFGMVLLEAAQMSLPVIAVATPHSRDFLPRYVPGQLFDGSSQDLCRQLNSETIPFALDDIELAANARRQNLSTATITSRWTGLLESASGGRSA